MAQRGLELPPSGTLAYFDPDVIVKEDGSPVLWVMGDPEHVRAFISGLPPQIEYPDGTPPVQVFSFIVAAPNPQAEFMARNSRSRRLMVVIGQLGYADDTTGLRDLAYATISI